MTPPSATAARLDSASLPLPNKKISARSAPARADRPFRGIALVLASTIFLGAFLLLVKQLGLTKVSAAARNNLFEHALDLLAEG